MNTEGSESSATIQCLQRIREKSQLSAYAHFSASERMSKLHYWLGLPTTISIVILGSVLMADLQEAVPSAIKWVAGMVSLVAAILSSMQTFINPKDSRVKHREIGNDYLSINRKSEFIYASFHDELIDVKGVSNDLADLDARYEAVNKSAQEFPTNPGDWARAKDKYNGLRKRTEF